MVKTDPVTHVQEALGMGVWERFWYPVRRFFSGEYFQEYEWLLKVQGALEGKDSLGLSAEDKWKLVIEEDSAHIQETTAVLRPFYEARTQLGEEASYLDNVIMGERSAREFWKTELQEIKNELSRMEALIATQEVRPESLNALTVYRRRLLVRRSEASFGLGLSQRRLNQSEGLREKLEDFLAHAQNQVLTYELKRREFVAHKESACMEYQSISLGGVPPLSGTKVLQSKSKDAQQEAAKQREVSIEYASLALENSLGLYLEEDQGRTKSLLWEFEEDLSDVLNQDEDDLRGGP